MTFAEALDKLMADYDHIAAKIRAYHADPNRDNINSSQIFEATKTLKEISDSIFQLKLLWKRIEYQNSDPDASVPSLLVT